MDDAYAAERSLAEIVGERPRLLNLAFRMLGTTHDAEDVVQETYARWYRLAEAERAAIRVPQAWLTRVASRICLDTLGSARSRREQYIGEWLPEPVPGAAPDPLEQITLDESVSMALMVMLEALTPAERVAFVLHDVFALPFEEIAAIVGRTPQACRKLASTARQHLRDGRQRASAPEQHAGVVRAFWGACNHGDLGSLVALLDPEATAISDGGGRVRSALNPIRGADRIARFVLGLMARRSGEVATLESVSGRVGVVFRREGVVVGVASFDVRGDRVANLWLMFNPDKLRRWNRR